MLAPLLAAAKPSPALRLLVIHDSDELLGSEQRALAGLRKLLSAKFKAIDDGPVREPERRFALSCLAGVCDAALSPPELAAQDVVLLHFAPYVPGKIGKRVSRGVSDILVFRAGEREPVYQIDVDESSAVVLDASEVEPLLTSLLERRAGE